MNLNTKTSLSEVRKRCRRDNADANNRLHWFSSKFSVYFSFLFIRMGLSADFVTILFFLFGLFGAALYSFNSMILSIIGYVSWRLHIIIDMSDGDVARFNKSFSIRGAYWDAVIHLILNPLYFLSVSYSFYLQFSNNIFLMVGGASCLSMSILMGVKSTFYKAKFLNKELYDPSTRLESNSSSFSNRVFVFLSEALGMEGFILMTIVARYVASECFAFVFMLLFFSSNIMAAVWKFISLSYYGYYRTKN